MDTQYSSWSWLPTISFKSQLIPTRGTHERSPQELVWLQDLLSRFQLPRATFPPLSRSFRERHQHWTKELGNQNIGTRLKIILEWVQISNFQGGSTHKSRNQDWFNNPGYCSSHGHISMQDSLPKTDKEFKGYNHNSSSHRSNSPLQGALPGPELSAPPLGSSHTLVRGWVLYVETVASTAGPALRGWEGEKKDLCLQNTCSSTCSSNPYYWSVSKKESTWKHSCFDHFQLPNLWAEGFTQPQLP